MLDSPRTTKPLWRRAELPTWGLATAIYGGWLLSTYWFRSLPLWLMPLIGGWLVAWHGSLQHEAVHGHPTRSPLVNALIAGWPLWLYLPYPLYRESHLAHHDSPAITDPLDDPESWYIDGRQWKGFGRLRRGLHRAQSTLVGRLLLGPAHACIRLFCDELTRVARGDRSHLWMWLVHAAVLVPIVLWVTVVCDIPLWLYVLCYAYPGLALTLLRSYAEHRPGDDQHRRTAVVESGPVLSLLFLNNNLHALHHAKPRLPWYEYRARYRDERDVLLRRNGGYLIRGYGALLWRFALRSKDSPVHPG